MAKEITLITIPKNATPILCTRCEEVTGAEAEGMQHWIGDCACTTLNEARIAKYKYEKFGAS